jgi:hypothetical protein
MSFRIPNRKGEAFSIGGYGAYYEFSTESSVSFLLGAERTLADVLTKALSMGNYTDRDGMTDRV